MPDLMFHGSPQGPLVNVNISPDTHYQTVNLQGQPIPTIPGAQFLIDTGSSHCLVDEDLIAPLGLFPVSSTPVNSVATGSQAVSLPIYVLSLLLYSQSPAKGWYFGSLAVTAAPASRFAGLRLRGLIGRDVLDRGVLHYDGPARQFRITF